MRFSNSFLRETKTPKRHQWFNKVKSDLRTLHTLSWKRLKGGKAQRQTSASWAGTFFWKIALQLEGVDLDKIFLVVVVVVVVVAAFPLVMYIEREKIIREKKRDTQNLPVYIWKISTNFAAKKERLLVVNNNQWKQHATHRKRYLLICKVLWCNCDESHSI